MDAEDIVTKIMQKGFSRNPVIIAIDGFGGAGKSTLANGLKNKLRSAAVVEIDDFFLKEFKSDANKSNFDRGRLIEQVLLPLRNGEVSRYQKLVWDSNTLSDYHTIPKVDYVILEGVSSLHPELADYIDYKIWLDVPSNIAKERMVNRDRARGDEHGDLWDQWTQSYSEYKDLHHPEKSADLVVSDTL